MDHTTQWGVTIVVPVFNEQESIPAFLPQLLEFAKRRSWRIIVVDDGSVDGSYQRLSQYKSEPCFQLVRHPVNRGYGAALKTGISLVNTECVITLAADGQHRPIDAVKLSEELRKHGADMVIGRRTPDSTSIYRYVGRRLIRCMASQLITLNVEDLNSGMKAYRTSCVKRYIPLCPNGMPFSDIITLIIVEKGHTVLEKGIKIGPRLGGKSTINTMTAVTTALEIFIIAAKLAPIRVAAKIFGTGAIIYLFSKTLWSAPQVNVGLIGKLVSVAFAIYFTLPLITGPGRHLIQRGNRLLSRVWLRSTSSARSKKSC